MLQLRYKVTMNAIIPSLETYLQEKLGISVNATPWKDGGSLPFFLRELYEFYEIILAKKPCLLILIKSGDELNSSILAKHFKLIQTKWTNAYMYVCKAISSYSRKRLIEHFVPFVVPNKQMYLPDLGIDLTEHFRKERMNIEIISPATQAVVIYTLLKGDNPEFGPPTELARILGYSKMTMSRAADEIESTGIQSLIRSKDGRLRTRDSKPGLWKSIKPFLRTPVKKRLFVRQLNHENELEIAAGLTALAHKTTLSPPKLPVFAVDTKTWEELTDSFEELPTSEEADFELEIWIYNPKQFAKEGLVDPLSLYLSFQDTKDERIEAALEQLMEQIKWSKD